MPLIQQQNVHVINRDYNASRSHKSYVALNWQNERLF